MSAPVYMEDYEVGTIQEFGAYEVTEEEILEFAKKYDPQFFHVDVEAAKESWFGGLIASGWHTCAMTMRMLVDSMEGRAHSLGSPGVDEVRWRRPVRPGDILSVKTEITELRPSRSRPGFGSLHQDMTVSNHKGEVVMTFKSIAMLQRRPAEDAVAE
ncbi:MAG: MaoC family dehydratase [Proteobacteria bacterium]|nr:MaoC family dehydratase [Pseudomonadota bacterium]